MPKSYDYGLRPPPDETIDKMVAWLRLDESPMSHAVADTILALKDQLERAKRIKEETYAVRKPK